MSNPIKYNTSAETLALKSGNFYIGTGDVGKGPTSTTGYYDGITPPSGGYTIYLNKASGGPSIYIAANDSQLISLTNSIAGASYTTVAECLQYYVGQNDKVVVNRDYPAVITDGLVLNLDAGFTPSYPQSQTTWYDLSGNANNCTLVNGPAYSSSQGGGIQFDATDDYATIPDNNSLDLTELTISLWFNRGDILPLPSGDQHNLFIKGNTSVPVGGDQINYSIGLYGPTGGGNIWWSNGSLGGGECYMEPSTQILFANQWYNLCYTHVSGNAPVAYLNGVQTNYTVIDGSVTNPIKPNTWQATISGDVNRATNKSAAFNGIMSIVQLYNRALSETEVLQNWNVQKGRFGL